MAKIDTSGWKEFRVGDLFFATRGRSRYMQALDEGGVPVIAAARSNQGIAGYYDVPFEYDDAITISCNGVGCGSTFYHDYPFAITGDAIVLQDVKPLSSNVKRFISAVYDSYFTSHYSYAEKCSADKAMSEWIKLPATPTGEPDWDYMDKYMSEVMKTTEASLLALRRASGEKHAVDVSDWKEFRVGDLFIQLRGKEAAPKQVLDGKYPMINELSCNNGVAKYGDSSHIFKGNSLTVSVNYAENVFYQASDFMASVNILILQSPELSELSGLFFATILKNTFKKYDYISKISKDRLNNEVIRLPVDSFGKPDWDYMDKYMSQMMQGVNRNLDVLRALKIESGSEL